MGGSGGGEKRSRDWAAGRGDGEEGGRNLS